MRECEVNLTVAFIACLAWQFWFGALIIKAVRAEKQPGDWGGSNFYFFAASPLSRALDNTVMPRRL